MKSLILLLLLIGCWLALLDAASAEPVPQLPPAADASLNTQITYLNGQIQEVSGQVRHFRYMAYWLQGLTVAVILSGLAVGVLQPGATPRRKVVVSVLGFASAAIVAITHTLFLADYRAYYKGADQMDAGLKDFFNQSAITPALDKVATANLMAKFMSLEKQLGDLKTELDTGGHASRENASQHGFDLIPQAWAQGLTPKGAASPVAPPWATQVPVDGNIYFLGEADGKTLDEAQQNALANGRTNAALAYIKESSSALASKDDLVQLLAKSIGNAAEVAQTFVAPLPGNGFRGYILLRLPRSAALFDAQSVFVRAGVPYDMKFLDKIKGEAK